MPPRLPAPWTRGVPGAMPSRCLCRPFSSCRPILADDFSDRPSPSNLPSPQASSPIRLPEQRNNRHSQIFNVSKGLVSELSAKERARRAELAEAAAKVAEFGRAADLEKQMTRRWKAGDVYAPHDLSPTEMTKWKKRIKPSKDAFDELGINPIDEYKNFSIMSEYMTEMGRIKHSSATGLRPVNQRRVAKAIRRAVGMGLMPSVHRHPQILEIAANKWGRSTRQI